MNGVIQIKKGINEMKEKYKAIIEKKYEGLDGTYTIETLTRYTCANNAKEAERNIIYHLQNDDRIYLGIDKTLSNDTQVITWELTRLDLERNFEEIQVKGRGKRGKDKKQRVRRTNAEIENDRNYQKIEVEINKKTLETLESYLSALNLNEKEYINDLIEKDLKSKKGALNKLKEVLKELR